jgi:hypothetical protein
MTLLRRNRKSRAERLLATAAGMWAAMKGARAAVKAAAIAVPVAAGAAIAARSRRRPTDFGGINDGAESHQPPVQAAQQAAVS